MSQPGPRRGYRAPLRQQRAAETRRRVLDGARELFLARGYRQTSIADIAERAGVNADTVYAAVGRKPLLLRELVEEAISGADHPIPADERDYVRAIRAAPGAREKLRIYAAALGVIQQRLAPIFLRLSEAAVDDPDCAALWREISARRARNMLDFAADLRATGELRPDLDDEAAADIVWAMNGPEFYGLLAGERGWSPERFALWLADAWGRLLLA